AGGQSRWLRFWRACCLGQEGQRDSFDGSSRRRQQARQDRRHRDLLCQSQGSRFSSSRTGCLSKESASLRGRMLARRMESSSKYYKELPCVIAKSLIAKYQKN